MNVDINLVIGCVTVLIALGMALVLRKPEKITEAADKARTDASVIKMLEDNAKHNALLLDALNVTISFLHRSIPADSIFFKPVEAVDALIDEITDDIPAADKPKDAPIETITVSMPSEPGTSVQVVKAE